MRAVAMLVSLLGSQGAVLTRERTLASHSRLILTLCLALLLPEASISAAPEVSQWNLFTPPEKTFSVKLPGVPGKTTRSRWLPIGTVESTVYKVELPMNTFGLSITDLPRLTFAFRSRDKVIETTAEGFIEDAGAQQTDAGTKALGGQKAKEVSYTIPANSKHPELRGVSRMLIDDKRLYIFYAEVESSFPPEEVKAYFDSVRFLNQSN